MEVALHLPEMPTALGFFSGSLMCRPTCLVACPRAEAKMAEKPRRQGGQLYAEKPRNGSIHRNYRRFLSFGSDPGRSGRFQWCKVMAPRISP